MKTFYISMLLFLFLLPQKLYTNNIHPDLHLKLLKNVEIELNSILKFKSNKMSYDIIIEFPESKNSIILSKENLEKKVKSVFLYDINGDNINEIFIIFNQNNKNSLEGYSLKQIFNYTIDEENFEPEFFKTLNIATKNEIDKKIANIKNFDASSAKKELEKLFPYYKVVNFNNYNQWDIISQVGKENYYSKSFYYLYELDPSDYEIYNLQKYFNIYSLNNLTFHSYINEDQILMKNDKYFFTFNIQNYGLITLEEVFEGKDENGKIIKNGKYYNSKEYGSYTENIKNNIWTSYIYYNELERYIPIKLTYNNGVLIQKDILYRYSNELKLYSSEFYNEKNEIDFIHYYDPNGEISQIKKFKNNILEKVMNYTHFKREYGIFDKKTNPKTGYEYYEARKSLSSFKNLNIIDAKIENKELNLYSLPFENGKNIFIIFQNYSPGKVFTEGLRYYEDPLKYFGIKEIFYGEKLKDNIQSLDDILKNGYFEEFNLGSFPGVTSITRPYANIESIISSGIYKNNKKDGIWKTYSPNRGDLLDLKTYKNDILDGSYEIYQDEILSEKGKFINSEKIIEWKAPPMFIFSS